MIQGEKPMTRAELVLEVEWLLQGGVHPELICLELSKSPGAIDRLCRNESRHDLAGPFNALDRSLRNQSASEERKARMTEYNRARRQRAKDRKIAA